MIGKEYFRLQAGHVREQTSGREEGGNLQICKKLGNCLLPTISHIEYLLSYCNLSTTIT